MTIKRKFLLVRRRSSSSRSASIGLGTGLTVRAAQHDQVRRSLETIANLEAPPARQIDSTPIDDRLQLTIRSDGLGLRSTGRRRATLDAALADRAARCAVDGPRPERGRPLSLVDARARSSPTPAVPGRPTPRGRRCRPTSPPRSPSIELGAPYAVGRRFRVEPTTSATSSMSMPVADDARPPAPISSPSSTSRRSSELFGGRTSSGARPKPTSCKRPTTAPSSSPTSGSGRSPRFATSRPGARPVRRRSSPSTGLRRTYDDVSRLPRRAGHRRRSATCPNTPWALVVKIDEAEAFAGVQPGAALGLDRLRRSPRVFAHGALALVVRFVLRRIRKVADSAAADQRGRPHRPCRPTRRTTNSGAGPLVRHDGRHARRRHGPARREIEAELAHSGPPRPAHRPAQPPGLPAGVDSSALARGDSARAPWQCCSATSTSSRRSTTTSATPPATPCCARSRPGCSGRVRAASTCSPDSAATSSSSSPASLRESARRRSQLGRTDVRSPVGPDHARRPRGVRDHQRRRRDQPRRARPPRRWCATPTRRCTRPRASAGLGSSCTTHRSERGPTTGWR